MSLIAAGLLALAAAAEGPPLFYWGARPAVITAPAGDRASTVASVLEVHAAQDAKGLILRLTFDRPVKDVLFLPDGTPVSGRLRAVLYCDSDGERATGWNAGESDLRRGAEWRLEVGTLAMGADPEEHAVAQALVTVTLVALTTDGRQRSLWSADHQAAPREVSFRGEWLELRLPRAHWQPATRGRLILAAGDTFLDGRIPAP